MTDSSLKQARILIVDDQVANTALLENILGRIGYTNLHSITDSREVAASVSTHPPDLVILDITMPHIDGFQVMGQLAGLITNDAHLPVLVLTADITPVTKRKALAAGATDLLHKPFDVSEIFMRIRSLLQTRFLHLEIQDQNRLLEQKVAERTSELAATLEKLKQTQRQMVQQERLRAFGEMAGGVVHDFNNALMSVIGYSELILKNPALLEDKPTVLDYLKTMNTAGRDASHVVSRLRDFYRPREDGDVFLAVDLNDVITEAVSLTQPKWKDQALASGRTIAVELDLQKIPPVSGNPAELREALTNLIFNAVDAMPEGGVIALRTRREAEKVVFEASDTGTGMEEEVRARCLEPFFSTKAERGTGLGLSMVFGIIQRHEGVLEIESERGSGTTFRVSLPSQVCTFEPEAAHAFKAARSLRILVVDDEFVPRDVITKYLLADGHEVVAATTAQEGIDRFKTDKFDLVITDHAMPEINGSQFAEILKRIREGQPILMLTGFSDPALPKGELPPNVDLLLSKPTQQRELREAVASFSL
ncbi:MAG: response regulator [Verrucomicrobiota bacterium]|nr:response regulator [Verrucomicrobiota bacterium]